MTWDSAFATIGAAISAASSNACAFTKIVVSGGVHDVASDTEIDKRVHIQGMKRGHTILTNTESTTRVIQFAYVGRISDLDIHPTGAQDGIVLNGASEFTIRRVNVDCSLTTGAVDGILVQGGTAEYHIEQCHIEGIESLVVGTTGIRLNQANSGHVDTVVIHSCLIGIHITNAADDQNYFHHITFDTCTTGVLIAVAGASNNVFSHADFIACGTNVDDNGTTTQLLGVSFTGKTASVAPDNLTGVTITAGVGAGVWTVTPVQIRAAGASPFYVTGITYELATQERYELRLSADGGTTWFWAGILEERVANRTKWLIFGDNILIPQGAAIHGTVRSETGGNNFVVWIHILEV